MTREETGSRFHRQLVKVTLIQTKTWFSHAKNMSVLSCMFCGHKFDTPGSPKCIEVIELNVYSCVFFNTHIYNWYSSADPFVGRVFYNFSTFTTQLELVLPEDVLKVRAKLAVQKKNAAKEVWSTETVDGEGLLVKRHF